MGSVYLLVERPGELMATLPSNDGEERLTIDLAAPAVYAHDAGYESSIHLSGRHWDGDHTFPFSTSIAGLWLRTADLTALRRHVTRWVGQPLECLKAGDLTAEFQLARLPGQSLHVRFGPRPDTISDLNPVVSIGFSAGQLRGKFHFVTDQSCLTLFASELSSEIIGSHETAV